MKVGAGCLALAEPGDGAFQVVLVVKNLPPVQEPQEMQV